MGRALKPTRRVRPGQVRAGDVVLVRAPAGHLRWMIVDWAPWPGIGAPYVWSGRWAFGGQWTIYTAHHSGDYYTVKDKSDATRDAERLRKNQVR